LEQTIYVCVFLAVPTASAMARAKDGFSAIKSFKLQPPRIRY